MIKISLVHSVSFVWLGKFVAPSSQWIHTARKLHEYELMVVDSGILYIANEEHSYEVHPGEYVLMRPCQFQHGYQASQCSFHWIHFVYNESFNDLEGDYIEIPEHGKVGDLERISKILSQIYYVWQNYSDPHYASYLVTTLLMEVNDQNLLYDLDAPRTNAPVIGHKRPLKTGQLSRRIEAYLKWNCSITTHISDVADYLGYSEKYLSNVFKKETGKTIRRYLDEQIVERGKESLLTSDYTVAQIGYSLGFSDTQNFSRIFKKISGLTPTEFRKQFGVIYEP